MDGTFCVSEPTREHNTFGTKIPAPPAPKNVCGCVHVRDIYMLLHNLSELGWYQFDKVTTPQKVYQKVLLSSDDSSSKRFTSPCCAFSSNIGWNFGTG